MSPCGPRGAVLLPLGEAAAAAAEEVSTPDKSTAGFGGAAGTPAPSSSKKRKRRRVAGMVNGSMGVVRQLHALTVRKCLRFDARVVGVCEREDGEARVVVLIDLYLPIAVWIDWQFPKSGALAACLFKHARCEPTGTLPGSSSSALIYLIGRCVYGWLHEFLFVKIAHRLLIAAKILILGTCCVLPCGADIASLVHVSLSLANDPSN